MLPKKNRVDTKEVDKIFKDSKFLNSSSFSFKYLKNKGRENKISFIVPKNVAKLAVKRNFLRRRGYSALQNLVKNLRLSPTGLVGVFVFKKYQDDISIIENEIKNILSKVN